MNAVRNVLVFVSVAVCLCLCPACSSGDKQGTEANQTQLGDAMLHAVGNAKVSAGAEKSQEQDTTKQIETDGAQAK